MKPPDYPQDGKPVKDTVCEIIDYVKANTIKSFKGGRVKESRGGITLVADNQPHKRTSRRKLPFDVFLKKIAVEGGDPTWQVSVHDGYVIETRIKSTIEKSVTQYLPTGIKDEAGEVVWHDIEPDEAVYVQYSVAKDGMITGEPSITVDEDDIDHAHYYPEAFDYVGADGGAYVKLAVFKLTDEKPKLEIFCSGSHIKHVAERGKWENFAVETDGTIRKIGKTYDSEADKYVIKPLVQLPEGIPIIMPLGDGVADEDAESIEFRSLIELEEEPQIRVSAEPTDGSILIRGNGVSGDNDAVSVVDGLVTVVKDMSTGEGQDLDLIVSEFNMTTSGGFLIEGTPAYPQTVDCWRKGVYVGSFDYGDTLPAATGGAVVLTTRYVSRVTLT